MLYPYISAIVEFLFYHPFQSIGILLVIYCVLFGLYNQTKWEWIKKFAGPPFLLLDFLVNMIPFTIVSLDPPREYLVSARLSRYKKFEGRTDLTPREEWCLLLRRFFKPILNYFDPNHIK
jgi:hypothetical protein